MRMKKFDEHVTKVVITGSGVAARSARHALEDVEGHSHYDITVIRRDDHQVVPCALPYTFNTLKTGQITIGDESWEKVGSRIVNDEVVEIDREKQQVQLKSGMMLPYDRLIMATGASPIKPPVQGIETGNVEFVEKNADKIASIKEKAISSHRVVVIGGGFIGVELADELGKASKSEVHLIEAEDRLLPKAFDETFSKSVENGLTDYGVRVHTEKLVKQVGFPEDNADEEDSKYEFRQVVLSDGSEISADLVICAIGVVPNNTLAKQAGLETDPRDGGVITDDFYYTSDSKILACGDCVAKRDAITGQSSGVRLASTAAMEGKLAGLNIEKRLIPQNNGVINLFSTKVNGVGYAAAGITEQEAVNKGYETISLEGKFPDRHPRAFDDTTANYVKLIYRKMDGVLLGGQAMGSNNVGEFINAVGLAVTQKMTAYQLAANQYATHPLLTTGPTGYPLLKLSVDAVKQL